MVWQFLEAYIGSSESLVPCGAVALVALPLGPVSSVFVLVHLVLVGRVVPVPILGEQCPCAEGPA
jgi:hypothetical protein